MNTKTHPPNIARVMFRLSMLVAIATLYLTTLVLGQTTFKSSAEQRMKRIEEHQRIRRAALELTQDLRAIQLTSEQRQEIHQVLKRYNKSTGTTRRDPNAQISATETATQPTPEGSGSSAPPQVAERLRTEVAALLTSEQSERLNSIRQEREARTQKNPDFHIKKKP